jgi:hypothetical protein
MKPLRYSVKVKNLLIGAGAYYLSWWVASPLTFGFGKLTQGIIYRGDFAGWVVMPLVARVPVALVAAGVGASVISLVESDRPMGWSTFPALLYAFFGFLGYHWGRPPELLDRVEQTISALFPAVTCVVGGMIAARRRAAPRAAQIPPG